MKIAVYCEAGRDTGLELIGRARDMAPEAHISALVETPDDLDRLKGLADEAVCLGLKDDDCAQGTKAARALKTPAPDIALFPATVRGRFLSAWAAAKLDTGLTADCTGLDITFDGLLRQTRPAYGSNLTAQILCREKRPQMASVRPKVFPMPRDEDRSACPMVITDPGEIPAGRIRTAGKARVPFGRGRGRYPQRRGRGMGALRASDRPDRRDGAAAYVYRFRHQRHDPAHGGDERLKDSHRRQHGQKRADLQIGGYRYRCSLAGDR